jgi:GNAT superfamily N-acetyltransferase
MSQFFQPGGGLDLSFQQVPDISAEHIRYLARQGGVHSHPGDLAKVPAGLEKAQHLLGVQGEGRSGLFLAAGGAEQPSRRSVEVVGGRLELAVTVSTLAKLGAVAGAFQKVELEVAQDELHVGFRAKPFQGSQEQVENGPVLLVLGGELVDQLGDVKAAGRQPEVIAKGEETIDGLAAGDGIQVAASGEGDLAVSQEFEVAGQLALGLAEAPGEPLDLAEAGREKREDGIRLPQLCLLDDDGIGLVVTRFRHNMRWLHPYYIMAGSSIQSLHNFITNFTDWDVLHDDIIIYMSDIVSDRKAIILRDAHPDELDAVALLLRDAYKEYARNLPPDIWEGYLADMMDVRSRLGLSELIVAKLEDEMVGTVTLYPKSDGSTREAWPKGWAGVRLLGVHPSYRGKGIGHALMDECIRRCRERGVRAIGLHTTTMMEVARGMYERMGFVRIPQYDFHPRPRVIVMAYKLEI